MNLNYSLRKSTKERTKASVERRKVLEEIEKAKNTSILIGKLRSQEEKAYINGVLELAKFTAKVYRLDSSSSDEDLDSSKSATSSHQEIGVVTNDRSGETSDLQWDHFGDIESPEKPENYSPIFLNLSQVEPAVWSLEVDIEETRMDEQVYNDRLKVIRTEVRKTTCRINEFTPEVITLNHKDTIQPVWMR